MRFEVEQKFPIADLSLVEQKLAEWGAMPEGQCVQIDQYYAHPCRDFARTDEALRIRRVDDSNYLTYKGPKLDATTKTRREIELPLASGPEAAAAFAELLSALGFKPVGQVLKERRGFRIAWQGRDVDVALDQVEGLGSFIELELLADDSELATARDALAQLASALGLENSERRSYLELLLRG